MSILPSFDEMRAMDPKDLEELRLKKIKEIIDSAPITMQRKLHGLQWQIDTARDLAKTPMGACISLSRMMHDSLLQLKDVLNAIK